VLGVPVFVYLPRFYTDSLGVSLTALGALFLAGRLFDAISDPMVGAWSDRLRSRWGRRKPFIALGSLPLVVAAFCLYSPPQIQGTEATWWFGAFFFLTFWFATVVFVPYKALGPELSHDYDERTSIFALRDSFLMGGTLLAAAGPALIEWWMGLDHDGPDQRTLYLTYVGAVVPITLLTTWWCARQVKEDKPRPRARIGIWEAVKQALQNRPFYILLAAYTIVALGSNLPPVLLEYFATYVLGRPELVPYVLGGYFLAGMLAMPLWVKLSRRWSKKAAWVCAMLATIVPFAPVYLLDPEQITLFMVATCCAGTGGVAMIALPASIQADVIDYDELRTGQRREGLFISLWSIAEKSAYALGVGLALPILDAFGYVPNQPQSQEVVQVLRVLYVLVPCVCFLVGIVVGLAYPLSRRRHAEVLEALERRCQGESVEDPLRKGVILPPLLEKNA
jgi:GPH family glycoside/pentoside/hexuronide:cation symporter